MPRLVALMPPMSLHFLTGAELDEERRFEVTYPDDFKDEELAGKTAEFAVKVTALKERVIPELDEDLVADPPAMEQAPPPPPPPPEFGSQLMILFELSTVTSFSISNGFKDIGIPVGSQIIFSVT